MKTTILLFSFMSATYMNAQILSAGDIVVLGYAADTGTATTSYDEFSWAPLVDLSAGTVIYFTDAGYNTIDGDYMGTGLNDEILIRYTVPAGGIPAGTVFTVTEASLSADYAILVGTKFGNDSNAMLTLPNAGDQIFVFQSTDDDANLSTFGDTNVNPVFMVTGSSLSFNALATSTAGITPVSDVDNLTNLPPGLTDGVNAIATGSGPAAADETDNARYVGPTSGTKEELLAAVTQLSNWSRHDAAFGNDLAFGTAPNSWTANGVTSLMLDRLSIDIYNTTVIQVTNDKLRTLLIVQSGSLLIDRMELFSLSGQPVASNRNQQQIDISTLATGVYILKITIDGSSLTRKVIR